MTVSSQYLTRLAGLCARGVIGFTGRRIATLGLCALVSATLSTSLQAQSIVRVQTTMGDFSIELFDEATPATVENFLNYVRRGDYNRTFFHRSEAGFVLQGGGYRFVPFRGPVAVRQDAPVINESGLSNTRGTVAMARLTDPNSATNQWFVNLNDNSAALDAVESEDPEQRRAGYAVFGQILGDGMEAVERISSVPVSNLGGFAQSIPLRNYSAQFDGLPVARHLIQMNVLPVQRYSGALHVFEYDSGLLITTVDVGQNEPHSLTLTLVESESDIIFRVNEPTLIPLGIYPDGLGRYSDEEGVLRIDTIELNDHGNVRLIHNVVFRIIDREQLLFLLESYDEQ